MGKKVKLLMIQRGISQKSGNAFCRISVRCKKPDNQSVIREFWLSEDVANELIAKGISEDDTVILHVGLNDNLQTEIVSVDKADDDDDALGIF